MKFYGLAFALFFLLMTLFTSPVSANEVPLRLKCLWASYQNFKISANRKNIVLPNGVEMPFENRDPVGTTPDPHNLTSIDQMYMVRYPFGFVQNIQGKQTYTTPQKKDEMRGNRYNHLFLYLYGKSAEKVEDDLVPVQWVDGSKVLFNKRYGAADSLKRVVSQLYKLTRTQPELKKYLRQPLGGTYVWRSVAGLKNISMHGFGTAIDINLKYSDYWRWDTESDGNVPRYRNRIPPAIAEVFENNGFVWGGKWYRYDTMHFEYRPELLMNHRDCERIFKKYRD